MSIDETELSLYGVWKKTDALDFLSFLPAQYPRLPDFKYGLQYTNSKTFEFGYKVFEKNGVITLLIVDREFQIKRIDRKIKPALMTLVDDVGNEVTYGETGNFPANNKAS